MINANQKVKNRRAKEASLRFLDKHLSLVQSDEIKDRNIEL